MKRIEGAKRQRKTRSDKKREIQPVVPLELYETIARISFITKRPMKEVGERICIEGLRSKKVIEHLSKYFRRNYFYSMENMFSGDIKRDPFKIDRGEESKRLSIRFFLNEYDRIGELAYSLDMTIASATTLLLEASVKKTEIVQAYIEEFIEKTLSEDEMKQLKEVLRYINKHNPYQEPITMTMLINHIVHRFMDHSKNIKQVLKEWMEDITTNGH